MVNFRVNDKQIQADNGITVLQACLDNGIYIPNLCYIKDMDNPPASCRLCFVEIDGYSQPVTSCTTLVTDGMTVRTDTEVLKRIQKTAFELLLSTHNVDCKNCPANRKCELQRIAKYLHFGLKVKRLEQLERDVKIEYDHPFLTYHPDKCVLCGKCVYVCRNKNGTSMLAFAKRGLDTVISFFGDEDGAVQTCENCQLCIDICPVGAITKKTDFGQE